MTLLFRTCWSLFLFPALALTLPGARVSAAQSEGRTPQSNNQKPSTPVSPPDVETQKIEAPPDTSRPPATFTNDTGSMQAADVRALLTKVRFSEYRINDLLTDVRPERWKLAEATLASFKQSLESLHARVAALEEWRGQFDQRTDSLYLGFQTYAAINSVLPRLDGVARSVAEHETAGYAAQFSTAGGQLFDLQQTIGGYVGSLLKNQDQLLLGYQHDVATCQQDLSAAMRGQGERAKSMRNAQPVRAQRRSSHEAPKKPGGSGNSPKQEAKPGENKSNPPAKGEQKKQ